MPSARRAPARKKARLALPVPAPRKADPWLPVALGLMGMIGGYVTASVLL